MTITKAGFLVSMGLYGVSVVAQSTPGMEGWSGIIEKGAVTTALGLLVYLLVYYIPALNKEHRDDRQFDHKERQQDRKEYLDAIERFRTSIHCHRQTE